METLGDIVFCKMKSSLLPDTRPKESLQPKPALTLGLIGQGCLPRFPAGVAWGPERRAGPRSIPLALPLSRVTVIHLSANWPPQPPRTGPWRGGLTCGPLSAATASPPCPSCALRVGWEAREPQGQRETRSWAASSFPDARELTGELDRPPLLGVPRRGLGGQVCFP